MLSFNMEIDRLKKMAELLPNTPRTVQVVIRSYVSLKRRISTANQFDKYSAELGYVLGKIQEVKPDYVD